MGAALAALEQRRMTKPSISCIVAARLAPGPTLAQARTQMNGIEQRLAELNPNYNKGWTASVYPFEVEDTSPTLHRALYVLFAAVGMLLLIACANLANLTLARAALRAREISIRLALGATRGRVIRQLVAESLVVSIAGAAAGLLLAHWCIQGMLALKPPDIQRPELIDINWTVFAFAAALSLLTTLLFGLAPSICRFGRGSKCDAQGGREAGADRPLVCAAGSS